LYFYLQSGFKHNRKNFCEVVRGSSLSTYHQQTKIKVVEIQKTSSDSYDKLIDSMSPRIAVLFENNVDVTKWEK